MAANDSSTTKYVLEIDTSGGNFAHAFSKIVLGKPGTTLTGRELNAILLSFGYPVGISKGIDVRVVSSYGNNNESYMSNTVKVAVTIFADPSVLTATASSVTAALNSAADKALDFLWTASFPGYQGFTTYTLQYDSAGKGFVSAKEITIDPAKPFFKTMTQGDINTTALNSGFAGGETGTVEYRVKSTTALGAVVYSNIFLVTIKSYFPIVRLYMPGSYQTATGNGDDWTPDNAPELIRDVRPGVLNNMYYTYIYLPANTEFKITQGRSWDKNFGGTGGNLAAGSPDNLKVSAAGFYRVSVNRTTLKYDIREGRMGFVGGATGAGWTPPNVFPNYALGNAGTNLFVGLTDLASGGWKLIDNDQWNNGSNTVDETRSYGTAGGDGGTLEVNGANFSDVSPAGRYRVIWDGRDRDNIKYHISPATEMRLVGDGISQLGVNDWDPPSSPQMTYTGNGIWTITINLKANKEFKFLAGNAWSAFAYADNSGQSQATGTPRPVKWEGGNNFKTPATAGSYTLILNENAQTVTIN